MYHKNKKLLSFLLFTLLFTSCTQSISYTKKNSSTGMSRVIQETNCKSQKIKLNDLLPNKDIESYRQMDDKPHSLFIKSGGEWWQYNIKTKGLAQYNGDPANEVKPPSNVQNAFRLLFENFEVPPPIVISPDNKTLLYWIAKNIDGTEIIKSPNTLDDLSNEQPADAFSENIYLLKDGISTPFFIGNIPGLIKNIYWLDSGQLAILEMYALSPYYLYQLNLSEKSLTPLLSAEDTGNAPKFSLLDISPDGSKVLHQNCNSKSIFALDVKSKKNENLDNFPINSGAWWLPDGNSNIITFFEYNDSGQYSAFLYNLDSKKMQLVTNLGETGYIDLLQLTSKEAIIAMENDNLYIFYICIEDQYLNFP